MYFLLNFNFIPNMKKRIIIVALSAIVLIFGVVVISGNQSAKNLVELNVEALAAVGQEATCYKTIKAEEGSQVFYCGTCSWMPGRHTTLSGKGVCTPQP